MREDRPSVDHLGWRRLGPREEWCWYLVAGATYVVLAMWHKWLLNWFIGPAWLVVIVVLGPAALDRVRSAIGRPRERTAP